MLHFYFKDKLINDFFYKDVFCVPLELSSKLWLKLEINFISSDENIINPYLNNENIKIIVHKNYFYMILYFVKSLRKIKILWLFHLYSHSFLFSLVYKLINKKWKVYIKGDFNIYAINNLINLNKKYKKLLEYLLNKIDFLSFENNNLLNIFKNNIFYKNKILLIKNSLSLEKNKIQNNYKAKENIILALWRIYYEDVKRYSFLLKSLYNLWEQLKNWKIIFIWKTLWEFSWKSYDFLLENKEIIDNLY